jgi:hypothetical protein
VAALIKSETGLETEMIVGGRGEFTVWVGEETVAKKDASGFPDEVETVAAVRRALAASPGP